VGFVHRSSKQEHFIFPTFLLVNSLWLFPSSEICKSKALLFTYQRTRPPHPYSFTSLPRLSGYTFARRQFPVPVPERTTPSSPKKNSRQTDLSQIQTNTPLSPSLFFYFKFIIDKRICRKIIDITPESDLKADVSIFIFIHKSSHVWIRFLKRNLVKSIPLHLIKLSWVIFGGHSAISSQ